MATRKKSSKKSTKKSTKSKKGGVHRSQTGSMGSSNDWVPDAQLAEQWKMNRMGNDLPAGEYTGRLSSGGIKKRFGQNAFCISCKLTSAALTVDEDGVETIVDGTDDFKGRDFEIPFRLSTEVDFRILGQALTTLGYNPMEIELEQLPEIARELGSSGDEIRFMAVKTPSNDGRVYTNYRLLAPIGE